MPREANFRCSKTSRQASHVRASTGFTAPLRRLLHTCTSSAVGIWMLPPLKDAASCTRVRGDGAASVSVRVHAGWAFLAGVRVYAFLLLVDGVYACTRPCVARSLRLPACTRASLWSSVRVYALCDGLALSMALTVSLLRFKCR